jgi:hypothetical protein
MRRLTEVGLLTLVVVGLSIPVVIDWREETLARLQQCHREVPTSGRQFFESPCQSMKFRVLGLAGISVSQLEATLGPADRVHWRWAEFVVPDTQWGHMLACDMDIYGVKRLTFCGGN